MASRPLLTNDEFNSTEDPVVSSDIDPVNDSREANLGRSISPSAEGDLDARTAHSPMIELEYLYSPDTQLFLRRESAGTEALEDGSLSLHNSGDHRGTEEVTTGDVLHTPVVDAEWQPYTLKWPFLSLLTVSTLAILASVVAMQWYSATHHGLGNDDGSSVILFGWRFTPSLVAVLYVQMTAMLLDDAKRTEPFARMARTDGLPVQSTIFQSPGASWNALADGLSKRKNGGHRSWLLSAAALINIIGFLAISPLSASLLESSNIAVSEKIAFDTLLFRTDTPLSLSMGRETYLRILGHLLQNVTTSAWITDHYTVLPFWPEKQAEEPPLGPLLSNSPQTWQMDASILKTELQCEPLKLVNKFLSNFTSTAYSNGQNASLVLRSDSGCTYRLTASTYHSVVMYGGSVWTNKDSFLTGPETSISHVYSSVRRSEECADSELLFFSTAWVKGHFEVPASFTSELKILGYSCHALTQTAAIPITMQISSISSHVTYNETDFDRDRSKVTDDVLDMQRFQSTIFHSKWGEYVAGPNGQSRLTFGGLSAILAAFYHFNLTAMMDDEDIINKASFIKQRIFGEALQYSIQHGDPLQQTTHSGTVTVVQRRVLVISGVSMAIAALLSVIPCLLGVIWYIIWVRKRPLYLKLDPSSTIGAATLISSPSTPAAISLRSLHVYRQSNPRRLTSDECYSISPEGLQVAGTKAEPTKEQDLSNSDWRPCVLRLRILLLLSLTLMLLLTAIIVLYSFSRRLMLYQKLFVYETEFSLFHKRLPAVTPISIVPTLLAVGISLWWGAMDGTFRRLQPYISMANAPTSVSNSAMLSYQGTYWMAATVKAFSHKHFLLCLITFGTSLSPVFTIAMSALFQNTQETVIRTIEMERALEIRTVPLLYGLESYRHSRGAGPGLAVSDLIADLYQNLATNWVYGATLELSMNSSRPAWSKGDWSFIPIDLSQAVGGKPKSAALASSQSPAVNVSVSTEAIRGRVECTQYQGLDNSSLWLKQWDLSNHKVWNASTIPQGVGEAGYSLLGALGNTTILSDTFIIMCCANESSDEAAGSAIGYWSPEHSMHDGFPFNQTPWPMNITTKWIHGPAVSGVSQVYNADPDMWDILLFTGIPSIQALHCAPIIETATARVIVDAHSSQVYSYKFDGDIVDATEAWSEMFVEHAPTAFYINDSKAFVNYTISYGILFIDALISTSSMGDIGIVAISPNFEREHLEDNTFTFRDPSQGLSMDFMTYSMYAMAGKDPTALLDASLLQNLTRTTFSTFFRHYVSNNLSMTGGGSAYQPIGARLPEGILPPWNYTAGNFTDPAPRPVSNTSRTAMAEVHTRIELLEMNAAAVWLSAAILVWLIATTIVVAVMQRGYLKNLDRDIECVGDVLVLVAGSERLLSLARKRQLGELEDLEQIRTKLGWFEDGSGQQRWGIEVVQRE